MEYSNIQIPSRAERFGKAMVLVTLFTGLGCAALYAFGNSKQVTDMVPAVNMAMFAPQQKFMQRSAVPIMGCPIAVVSRTSPVAQATIKLGSDSGGLVFVPDSVTVKSGETVQWQNNAGFPHNIVFDEDNVPDGVDVGSISREDYLNAPGETYEIKFDKAGTYGYYCEPHRGAGMQGKIIVQ
jgi:plastocyanin